MTQYRHRWATGHVVGPSDDSAECGRYRQGFEHTGRDVVRFNPFDFGATRQRHVAVAVAAHGR